MILLQVDPDYRRGIPSLKTQHGLRAVAAYTTADPRPLQRSPIRLRFGINRSELRLAPPEVPREGQGRVVL